jgi:hypothetical protein
MLPGLSLFSQNGASPEAPSGPFVSDLRAEVRENLIRLSWIDSPDAQGAVYIYRSATPFGEGRLPVHLAAVPYGTGFFIDEADSSGTVYYFAAASGETGRPHTVFVTGHNVLSVTVAAIPEPAPAPSGGTEITGIEARVEGESVIITCRVPEGAKNTILYRSVEPVRRTADLLSAVIVRPGAVFPFADYPVPGIPYYYTVIYEDELNRGVVRIQPGANSTLRAVEVLSAAEGNSLRSLPLPLLSIHTTVPGADRFSELPPVTPLGPAAAKAVEGLRPQAPPAPAPKKPRAFSEDLTTAPEGGEPALRGIVQGPFLRRDWENARDDLLRYLSLPRNAALEARARFYLGQACYFTGRYQDALIEFLLFQKEYPLEAGEWLETVLDKIVENR